MLVPEREDATHPQKPADERDAAYVAEHREETEAILTRGQPLCTPLVTAHQRDGKQLLPRTRLHSGVAHP